MPSRPLLKADRRPGTWDRGLDYDKLYRTLTGMLREHRRRGAWRSFCYASVLLIQLRNGSRVSEALEAALAFAREGRREVYIEVRKRRDGLKRLMVLPRELSLDDMAACSSILDTPRDGRGRRLSLFRVDLYARRRLGVNTHSLRYAFITRMLREGVHPAVIAKITGHSKLDYILRYTQMKRAEEILRGLG